MDRELLIEIGTEELPASWLPGLTAQFGARVEARLAEARLAVGGAGRDLQHAAAAGGARRARARAPDRLRGAGDGPAGVGGVRRRRPDDRRRPRLRAQAGRRAVGPRSASRRAKGVYLAHRRLLRGKAAVDVLPDVLSGALRDLQYPKQMRWDAELDDGKGELLSGRPIRWVLFLYGGRVVPFDDPAHDRRRPSSLVQDVRSGAVTFGHRFLTTSGRAGRAIKVKGFDDYRRRLAENFVILERGERHDRIGRELDAEARRRGGRVSVSPSGQQALHGGARPGRVPGGRVGHLRRRVPAAARGGADDDDDPPPALLPAGRRRRAR